MPFYNRYDDRTNFVADYASDPRMFAKYAQGYWWAARRLVEDLFDGNDHPDERCYPVVFLYRHAFELSLKDVIYRFRRLAPNGDDCHWQTHKLDVLSSTVREGIVREFPSDRDLLSLASTILATAKEFSQLDKSSFVYRARIDESLATSEKHQLRVNLGAVREQMNWLLEQLACVDLGLDAEIAKRAGG